MTTRGREICYWDSSAFIAWLLPEPDRREACGSVIRAAERGDVLIVTSAITLVEVIRLKGRPRISPENEALIRRFFEHDWIAIRAFERRNALRARELIWDHGLQFKDAVHVATAIEARISLLHSFDQDMLDLSGKVGDPLLTVTHPHRQEEMVLPFVDMTPRLLEGPAEQGPTDAAGDLPRLPQPEPTTQRQLEEEE